MLGWQSEREGEKKLTNKITAIQYHLQKRKRKQTSRAFLCRNKLYSFMYYWYTCFTRLHYFRSWFWFHHFAWMDGHETWKTHKSTLRNVTCFTQTRTEDRKIEGVWIERKKVTGRGSCQRMEIARKEIEKGISIASSTLCFNNESKNGLVLRLKPTNNNQNFIHFASTQIWNCFRIRTTMFCICTTMAVHVFAHCMRHSNSEQYRNRGATITPAKSNFQLNSSIYRIVGLFCVCACTSFEQDQDIQWSDWHTKNTANIFQY